MSTVPRDDLEGPDEDFRSRVKKLLAERQRVTFPSPEATEIKRQAAAASSQAMSGYERAAAVLSWFDPDEIRPVAANKDERLLNELLAGSAVVADRTGTSRWAMLPERRIAALRALRESNAIEIAQQTNTKPDDLIQTALDSYISGQAKPIEQQTLEELTVSHQVCGWLRPAGFPGLPTPEAIARRTDWLTLLQPFEHLAGGNQFRGRVDELQRLRAYVGVLPPGSLLESTRRTLEKIFKWSEKPPLSIYGPGGVGKSTLLARFILDHALAHDNERFPFVYLDCDRPEVDAGEPLTLLMEAIRQLGIEYPEAAAACEKLRSVWAESMARQRQAISTQSASVQSAEKALDALIFAIRDFSSTVANLGAADQPVLFVIDTFEEVQWRSTVYVDIIWKMLETIQASLPRLRVVISGRAELASHKTDTLPLTGLDEEAAVGYLQMRGISDERIARRVAQQIGGSPLSLKLAAELAQREGLDSDGRLAVSTHEYFFLKLDASLVQRQLYKRVLSHVHDEDVRRLAHPGLVLRRITPELILKVLAEPCGIEIHSLDEAKTLFTKLQNEVALVTVERKDQSLRHRQDLRLVMLELLRADDAEKVRRIHEAAVDYYLERSPLPEERAEEIYHRLQLDQDPALIDSRWIAGMERYLASAIEEFSGRRLAYLATRLKVDVDPATRELADLEDWEKITERNVLALLDHDQPQQALDLMRARTERSVASPLVRLEARALARLERWQDALALLDGGFRRTAEKGERAEALALALQAAEVVIAAEAQSEARRAFDRLAGANAGTLAAFRQLETVIRQLALTNLDRSIGTDADLRQHFRGLFDEIEDGTLQDDPALGHWAVTVFETGDAVRLARVVERCGVPQNFEREVRQLAAELTSFDAALSKDLGQPPGVLAQEAKIRVETSLTAAWSDFLLKHIQGSVREALSGLLRRHAAFIPGRVFDAFAQLMAASLGIRRRRIAGPETRTAPARLRPEHARQFQKALTASFTPGEFAEFLRTHLDRNVEAISSLGQPFEIVVNNVLKAAEREGWELDLAAQAYYAKRNSPAIAALAQDLGLTVLTSAKRPLEKILPRGGSFESAGGILSQMSGLEILSGQVCRIEIGNGRNGMATGFLVGVDLLLTAEYVVADVRQGSVSPAAVTIRFDYREAYGGSLAVQGTVFELARDWLIASDSFRSKQAGQGYALLRIAGSPGAQPIGSASSASSNQLRGWIELPSEPALLRPQDPILVLGYPQGRSLQLSAGNVVGESQDGRLIQYDASTLAGSGGGPCLTTDLQPVALHLGRTRSNVGSGPDFSFGILLASIIADLESKGLGDALRTRFA